MPILCETRPQISVRNLPPVFNKRLFKAQAGIVLADKILEILQRRSTARRSAEELHIIKPVVTALKEIHKGLQFIKEALCHVVTYQRVEADVEICKKQGESCLSCYYILNGSVEAKYDINNGSSGDHAVEKSNDCEITYTHVAGEYLGLVSGDGREFDYPPPDNIRTVEVSEFLRVDREQFHNAVKRVQNRYVQEIEMFIEEVAALKALPWEEKRKLVGLMARQEYPAGKVIVNQGDLPEHLFFVAKGRCQYYRSIFIDEVNRGELVKLGQIEKGEFFGESTILDSSPCFCSVVSIGPVTCFLVNKWALKTNESIIQMLRQNRRYFFNDNDIKHYIRDSDIWQSFKRCTITGLLEMAGKCQATIDRSEITPILSRAVDYGDAKRHSLKKPNHDDEIPGAPKTAEQLFVPPRSRRRSSAILTSSAAAVVKAVLLLRRNSSNETDSKSSFPFPTKRSSAFQELTRSISEMSKPRSAPARDSHRMSKSPTIGHRAKSVRIQLKNVTRRPHSQGSVFSNANEASTHIQPKPTKKCGASGKTGNENRKTRQTNKDKKNRKLKAASSKTSVSTDNNEKASAKADSRTNSPSFLPSVAVEKNVVQKPNVVVKEIINTGIPGRRFSPKSYRRFERSLFDVLDDSPTYEHSSSDEDSISVKSPVLNPWNISFAASKWMNSVRQRRRNSQNSSEVTEETGQPPIIVIEDWSPEEALGEKASDETDSRQPVTNRIKSPTRKTSRTPTPVLDDVTEESEEEVQKYENELLPSQRWYTPIHEARDACKQQLVDFKKEIESLEEQRKKLKRQQKKKKEEEEEEEKADEGVKKDTEDTGTNETPEKNASEETRRPATGNNRYLRKQVSLTGIAHAAVSGRRRAKTFSEVPLDRQRSGDQLRRTQSLTRFRLISVSAPNTASPSHRHAPIPLVQGQGQDRGETLHGEIQRAGVRSSRIERRNQLLRKKVEALEKITTHYS